MKTCTKCKIEKEETAFNKDRYAKSGLTTRCKICIHAKANLRELDKSKVCTICHVKKPATEFNFDNHGLYGVRADCKKCCVIRRKLYEQTNPEAIKKSRDNYNRSENSKINNKKWRSTEQGRAYTKKYMASNRKRINAWHQKYRNSTPLRHLYSRLGSSIGGSLRSKGISKGRRKWEIIVGYTVEELKAYLDPLILIKGWSWDGLGKVWEIDHKRPVSWYTFSSIEDPQVKACWALDNLQPLLISDNRRKLNHWSDHPDDISAGRRFQEEYFAALSA